MENNWINLIEEVSNSFLQKHDNDLMDAASEKIAEKVCQRIDVGKMQKGIVEMLFRQHFGFVQEEKKDESEQVLETAQMVPSSSGSATVFEKKEKKKRRKRANITKLVMRNEVTKIVYPFEGDENDCAMNYANRHLKRADSYIGNCLNKGTPITARDTKELYTVIEKWCGNRLVPPGEPVNRREDSRIATTLMDEHGELYKCCSRTEAECDVLGRWSGYLSYCKNENLPITDSNGTEYVLWDEEKGA